MTIWNRIALPRTYSRRARILALAGAGAVLAGITAWLSIPDYGGRLDDYGAGTRIYDGRGGLLQERVGADDTFCRPVDIEDVSEWVVPALVAAEDKRFFEHAGIDPLAILRAAGQNMLHQRRVSGASTISTLVVKLTEPRRRTLWTKLVEAHHARRLEDQLTKPDILEQFLNRAPFGSNIRGIEAASHHYFGCTAKELSLPEAALLVGLPQAPSRLRPDRHYLRSRHRRGYVLDRMAACDFIAPGTAAAADQRPIELTRADPPARAPHLCDLLLQRHAGRTELHATLDPVMQRLAEDALARHVDTLRPHGINGSAIVIINVRDASLAAMVGSPDFHDARHAGQVNGATARRSPGSTLKPFIYALAMHRGLCTPATLIADTPLSFRDYDPRNYNLRYEGPVSVRDALVRSLNIPALRCVQRIGQPAVIDMLRAFGLQTIDQPAEHYGLSIAVGTCDVTLVELANAYAALARHGVYTPLRYLCDDPRDPGRALLSPEAAYLVADILSGDERAMAATGHAADVVLPRFAWKTGTSNGQRDAWTIAWNPEYVVGVWMGNPDGASSRELVGGRAAAPLAVEVFRHLYPNGNAPWFARPDGLSTRTVCAVSGCVPNHECTATITDDYLPGISEATPCDIHRIDPATGRACTVWPPDIRAYLAARGIADITLPPGHEPLPTHAESRQPLKPRIVSPADGDTLKYLDDGLHAQQLALTASSPTPNAPLYWFVDGTLATTSQGTAAAFWTIARGNHTIACTTPEGQTDRVRITVK